MFRITVDFWNAGENDLFNYFGHGSDNLESSYQVSY